jgi:hypothetical protein
MSATISDSKEVTGYCHLNKHLIRKLNVMIPLGIFVDRHKLWYPELRTGMSLLDLPSLPIGYPAQLPRRRLR